ncbi:MAG: ATP synthase F1 subunit epsilon [Actinobacteria bacterium]|nr:ATP synthase F1 subunit epsilon [Actinomycetota bacterium]MCG2807523.1 ATP synthase F1 subunit epsilon [Coriobacteriia bacterium]
MARTLMCEIITPERIVYTNEVEMVVAPTVDGEIGILPLHAPLVSALKPGEIRVKWDNDKEVEWFAVAGGYIQVHEDKVIILADHAVVASQIDVERARQALEHAKERMAALPPEADEVEVSTMEAELKWCEMQIEVAGRRK